MITSYLINTLLKQVKLSKSGANSYLISEYSIKTKTETKQLLQRYIDKNNHTYSNRFPSHRREAIDHFEVYCMQYIHFPFLFLFCT